MIHVSAELESFVMVICPTMTQPYNNVSDQNCITIWTSLEKLMTPTVERISTEQQQGLTCKGCKKNTMIFVLHSIICSCLKLTLQKH